MESYKKICKDCIDGKFPYNQSYYIIKKPSDIKSTSKKTGDITLVAPTRAIVEQAKSELKSTPIIPSKSLKFNGTELEEGITKLESTPINTPELTKINQSGGRSSSKRKLTEAIKSSLVVKKQKNQLELKIIRRKKFLQPL